MDNVESCKTYDAAGKENEGNDKVHNAVCVQLPMTQKEGRRTTKRQGIGKRIEVHSQLTAGTQQASNPAVEHVHNCTKKNYEGGGVVVTTRCEKERTETKEEVSGEAAKEEGPKELAATAEVEEAKEPEEAKSLEETVAPLASEGDKEEGSKKKKKKKKNRGK